jgi:hypothetical protein
LPQASNWDELYGEAIAPSRISETEKKILPRSLSRLDESSAALLLRLMEVTDKGLGVAKYVYSELPILWVIDESGLLWFSLEEVVDPVTLEFKWPKARRLDVTRVEKLGHPALISGGNGRIGGEILYDPGLMTPGWVITNASGRYGMVSTRKAVHLRNVVDLFKRFGMQLQHKFYGDDS